MPIHRWADLKKKMPKERRERLDAEVLDELFEMQLIELRELAGLTQTELARRTKIAQPQLSAIEGREDHLVSTLRRYVEALGGQLEVVAVLGNKRITLQGV